MKIFPDTEHCPVVRTDFSDPATWAAVCREIEQPSREGFQAYVSFVDDRDFADASKQQILDSVPEGCPHALLLVVDRIAITSKGHAVLALNLLDRSAEGFRVLASEVYGVENNLSVGNMDFEEFAGAVDADGVFRGFS